MEEHTFQLENISPLEVYGVNNLRLKQIKNGFPDVKFVARGDQLKVKGESEKIKKLKTVLHAIFTEIKRRGNISQVRFAAMLAPETDLTSKEMNTNHKTVGDDLILYGEGGKIIKAKTAGQKHIVNASQKNGIVFAIGPAGTGKTYVAVALAVKALKEK